MQSSPRLDIHSLRSAIRNRVRERGILLEQELQMKRIEREHAKRLRNCSPTSDRNDIIVAVNRIQAKVEQPTSDQGEAGTNVDSHSYENINDAIPQSGYNGYTDKVLYYAMFVLHFAMSKEEIHRMEKLMAVLYGVAPSITFERDVEPLMQRELEPYGHTSYYYCNNCSTMLTGMTDVCSNTECPLCRVNVTRAKSSKRVEVHVLNIIPQLEDIVSNHLREIIEAHYRVHRNMETTTDRSDVRLFPGFAENIESFEQFQNNQLRVMLSISTDGFKAKRIKRQDMWPLYMRVDDLDGGQANRFENTVLCGAIYGRTKPNDTLIDNLLSRFTSELESIKRQPIAIEFSGCIWKIIVALYRGVADMSAQQALFGIPRWNSEFGCSKCLMRGKRIEMTRVWFDEEGSIAQLRSPDSYLNDGRTISNGIPGITTAMKVMAPSMFSSDALHVCSEGITKDRLHDIFNPGSKFPGIGICSLAMERVKHSLLTASSHTYANATILSIEDMSTCSGSELDQIAFITLPLLAAVSALPSPVAAASLIGYWLCLRIIAKTAWLTTDAIEVAKEIAEVTKSLWISVAPTAFTLKCHWFFDHGMREELDNYGTMYQWSSSPFESHHRRLQININQTTTNSSIAVIDRFLLLKKVRSLLGRRCDEGNEEMRRLLDKVDNQHVSRFPMDHFITEEMYIPKNSFIHELLDEHQCFLRLQNGDVPFSRLVQHGEVYTSKVYWKRSRATRQDVVVLSGDDNDTPSSFGSILLFLYNSGTNTVKVVVEEFIVSNPFEDLGNQVNHYSHPCRRLALQVMRMVDEHNCFFKKVDSKITNVRSASSVIGPSCLVEYGSASYVSIL